MFQGLDEKHEPAIRAAKQEKISKPALGCEIKRGEGSTKSRLFAATDVCATTDIWTSRQTSHYILPSWELWSAALATTRISNDYIASTLKEAFDDWGITDKKARPHTSLETRTALDRLGLRTLPHPPYSPDLAPSDFFLFPKLKDYLKGNRYETDEDVKNAVLSWCRDKTADFFADGIQQVVCRWRLCIERDGDYVEK